MVQLQLPYYYRRIAHLPLLIAKDKGFNLFQRFFRLVDEVSWGIIGNCVRNAVLSGNHYWWPVLHPSVRNVLVRMFIHPPVEIREGRYVAEDVGFGMNIILYRHFFSGFQWESKNGKGNFFMKSEKSIWVSMGRIFVFHQTSERQFLLPQ